MDNYYYNPLDNSKKGDMNNIDQNNEFCLTFPVILYNMPDIGLIREMINIQPFASLISVN